MAAKVYRLSAAPVTIFEDIQEADAAAGTKITGWTVAKNASGLSGEMDANVEQTVFSSNATSPKPNGLLTGATANAFRIPGNAPLNGLFEDGNWTFVVVWRSVTTAHSGTLRVRIRVFKDYDSAGASPVELTASTQVGTTSGAGSTSADVSSTVTWSPGASFTFDNQWLFVACAMEVVTASGSNTADACLRTGSSTTVGTRFTTPNFVERHRPTSIIYQDPALYFKKRNWLFRPLVPRLWRPELWLPGTPA